MRVHSELPYPNTMHSLGVLDADPDPLRRSSMSYPDSYPLRRSSVSYPDSYPLRRSSVSYTNSHSLHWCGLRNADTHSVSSRRELPNANALH
jgi:hypothetical protein